MTTQEQDEAKMPPPPGHGDCGGSFDGIYCPGIRCEQHDSKGLYHDDGRKCEGFWHRLKCGRW